MFGFSHGDVVLGVLEVVNIRGIILCPAGSTCYQLGEFTCEGDVRWVFHVQQWYLVEHARQPLTVLFPVYVQTPDGVPQWLLAHCDLRNERLFR